MEQANELVDNSITTAPKKLLKTVSCIYVPCADPERTMNWFRAQFQLSSSDGPWLTLENGTDLMFIETTDETRMKYNGASWGGDPNFDMPILMFQVEDLEKLYSSMKQSGSEIGEIRDNGGCGREFYFYDPEGNKYDAWEMQTMVTRQQDRFVFDNCYFKGDISAFLSKVASNSRGSSKRVNFLDADLLRDADPKGLQEVIDILQEFNLNHPNSISIIGL